MHLNDMAAVVKQYVEQSGMVGLRFTSFYICICNNQRC